MGRALALAVVAAAVLAACGDDLAPPDPRRPLALAAVDPPRGGLPGGTSIVIDGAGFTAEPDGAAPQVIIGTRPATDVAVVDDFTLTATVPPGDAAGPVDVLVAGARGWARLDRAFTYNPTPAITALTPARGDAAGGTRVAITGSGFQAYGAGPPRVTFGDLAAGDVVVVSDGEIDATAPPGAPFVTVDVEVVNTNGAAPPPTYQYTSAGLVVGSNRYGGPAGLFFVDPTTGLTTRILTADHDPVLTNGIHSLAADPSGTIWGTTHWFGQPPELVAIDPYTRTIADVAPVVDPNGGGQGVPRAVDCKDLELVGDTLYCTYFANLYAIDRATGAATLVSSTLQSRTALAQVGDTTYALWSQCCSGAWVATFDPVAGTFGPTVAITVDGQPMTRGATKAAALHGELYVLGAAWLGPIGDVPASSPSRSIYRVDPATGAATLVGTVPFTPTSLTSIP